MSVRERLRQLRHDAQLLRREWDAIRYRQTREPAYTGVHEPHRVVMQRWSYGEPNVIAIGETSSIVYVGKFCSIAAESTFLLGGGHHLDWVTTCPNIAGRTPADHQPPGTHVLIGHDVWIGRGALILEGAEIETGAVVAAGAVVTGKVEPYTIVAGNPARPIRRRFPDDVCDRLLESRWWDIPDNQVEDFLPLLWSSRVDDFLDAIEARSTARERAA